VDHIDKDPANNRVENLRYLPISENRRRKKKSSQGPYVGVGWHKHAKKWEARVFWEGKQHSLGYFKTPEEGKEARDRFLQNRGVKG